MLPPESIVTDLESSRSNPMAIGVDPTVTAVVIGAITPGNAERTPV
jgi:hypothetical protein